MDQTVDSSLLIQRYVSLDQGFCYLITGLWPLFGVGTFQRVTGPKIDLWLVKMVGVLTSVIGAVILMAGLRRTAGPKVTWLAVVSAVGFAAIDTVHVARRSISPVYLADTVAELCLILIWFSVVTGRIQTEGIRGQRMAKASTQVGRMTDGTKREARKAVANPWVERLTRLGYFVRGLVYGIPGLLALGLAIGVGGRAVSPTGAIEYLGQQPYGKIMLIIVAIGLAGFSLWGLIRAVFDPYREGSDMPGLATRFGYLASAFGYATLLIATAQYLMGLTVNSNNPTDWTAKLLTMPWGRVAVAVVGLGWLGGGLWQIYKGYKADFKLDFKLGQMNKDERTLSAYVGRFGLAARGVVFALIGLFLVQAAVFVNPAQAKGLDGALLALAEKPFGQVLLAVVALGLIAFGVYSMLCARWMRIPVRRRAS